MKTTIVFLLLLSTVSRTLTAQNVKFAAIGDYGFANPVELAVSNLVKSWDPEFIITLGDNNYTYGDASTIDTNIGKYYHEYIYPYYGIYGAGSEVNRFFPALGNHDWYFTVTPYLNYFTLPGNERYYDFVKGDIHFFVIDSDPHEPDGIDSNSVQAQWLKNILTQSTQRWNIIYLHHAPFSSSSNHGSYPSLQWSFKRWGASAVLAGHDHLYERLYVGNLTYFVNGLGGYPTLYSFGTALAGSQFRYNSNYGAMLIQSFDDSLTFKFYDINNSLIDNYKILSREYSGGLEFAGKVDFTTSNNPISQSIGDIDGDGKLDLTVANLSSNTVSVLLNTSNPENINLASKVDFVTGNSPRSVSTGDLDGDGSLDLAVANYNSNTVSVYLNISSPGIVNFEPKVDFVTGNNPRSLSIRDMNEDGKPDLAVTNEGSNTVSVFRNTSSAGTVNFEAKSDFATGTNPLSLSTGDLNSDGKTDMAVVNYSGNSVSVLRNTSASGSINFAAKEDFATGSNPYAVSIGDLDGDTRPDIVVSNNTGNSVSVLRNTSVSGSISFTVKTDFSTGVNPNNIAIGDLNGDGKFELAVSNTNNNSVSVFNNTSVSGSISFSEKIDYVTGLNPYSVNIGDLDGDLKPDIATVNRNNNSVSLLRNLTIFQPSQKTIYITLIPQGFYNNVNKNLCSRDTVSAYLRKVSSPYEVVDSSKAFIDSNSFTGNFNFENAGNGTYFIVIKHRNSIETWSIAGLPVTAGIMTYDFTTDANKAYGDNLIRVDNSPVTYAMYSGDINQDGEIETLDLNLTDFDAFNFVTGYVNTDVTGNNVVDVNDLAIIDNNAFDYVGKITPP